MDEVVQKSKEGGSCTICCSLTERDTKMPPEAKTQGGRDVYYYADLHGWAVGWSM